MVIHKTRIILLWSFYIALAKGIDLQKAETIRTRRSESNDLPHESCRVELTGSNVSPGDEEHLCYITSKKFVRQISVVNTTAQVGVVVDSMGEKIAILNGETGLGVVIDKPLNMGVMIEKGGWSMYEQSLPDFLKDCNVTDLMLRNSDKVFDLEAQHPATVIYRFIYNSLLCFGSDLIEKILEAKIGMLKMVINLFGFIIYPLKNVLGPVIDIATAGWTVFKGGFLALLNIFKWMGQLVSSIAGGLVTLTAKAVRFPLILIITALDGARAFFHMLWQLTFHFDLIKILSSILTVPVAIARFIGGLGGEVAKGITGFFNVVAAIFEFATKGIAYGLQALSNIFLRFFGKSRPKQEEVRASADHLLKVAEDQKTRFHNEEGFNNYRQFLCAVKGDEPMDIKGISLGSITQSLTDQRPQSGTDNVVGIFNLLKPIVPIQLSIPHLLVSTTNLLKSAKGASYVESLIPSSIVPKGLFKNATTIEPGAVLRSSNVELSLKELKELPPHLLLQRLPVVNEVYQEIDDAVKRHGNPSLEQILQDSEAEATVRAFATDALKPPVK